MITEKIFIHIILTSKRKIFFKLDEDEFEHKCKRTLIEFQTNENKPYQILIFEKIGISSPLKEKIMAKKKEIFIFLMILFMLVTMSMCKE